MILTKGASRKFIRGALFMFSVGFIGGFGFCFKNDHFMTQPVRYFRNGHYHSNANNSISLVYCNNTVFFRGLLYAYGIIWLYWTNFVDFFPKSVILVEVTCPNAVMILWGY
jgi:hypothetical protein